MKSKRENGDYLADIRDYAEKALRFVEDLSYEEFLANEEKVLAVLFALQTIGEAANKLTRDFRDQFPAVPWADIVGMRNFIVHGYFQIDLAIVWRTLREDLPALLISLEQIEDGRHDG